jgi:hypothetical protein
MIERSEISCFKLTPTEKEYLREAAAHRSMTISELIRDALLRDEALSPPERLPRVGGRCDRRG